MSYSIPAPAQSNGPPEIPDRLERLEKEAVALWDQAVRLQEKLQPIVGPNHPDSAQTGRLSAPCRTALGTKLDAITLKLVETREYLDTLARLLEL